MTATIHPTAIVDMGAVVGDNVRIWHWTHVCAGAVIGTGSSLGQNVYIGGRARIGSGVKIQNNVSVYDDVILDNDVFCGPSVVFTNVINPRAQVLRKHEYRPTRVRRGATLGANATIVCGTTIGEYAFVAAGAVVTEDVPDFALVAGVPARHIGWMSTFGERLALPVSGTGEAQCAGDGSRYTLRGNVVVRVACEGGELG